LLNALSGVSRPWARSRSSGPDHAAVEPAIPATTRRLQGQAIGIARLCADYLTATPRARQRAIATIRGRTPATEQPRAATRRRLHRRHAILRLTTDRAIPLSVALVVLIAAGVSLAPAAAPVGAVQAETPAAAAGVRLTVGGGAGGPNEFDGPVTADADAGAVVDDGTLFKPVAVDTSVASSVGMLRHYTVRQGDTLTAIANRFGVSMMTVWWANNLRSKDDLHVGQTLRIPPTNGLVRTVAAGDTLDAIAARYKITTDAIVKANELTDTNVIVGQTLLLPGAQGDPIPLPKIVAKKPSATTSAGGSAGPGRIYPSGGGSWAWPVVGHNYVSQYFSARHPAIDIASTYGNPIISALPGTVVYAGWKDNGGGYQVWVSHGNGLYTGYYHMSAVTTSVGASVAQGEQVGRIGATGWATGPHCHFEVWVGSPWAHGSYRVNPLAYY